MCIKNIVYIYICIHMYKYTYYIIIYIHIYTNKYYIYNYIGAEVRIHPILRTCLKDIKKTVR